MKITETDSRKTRLESILRNEIIPKLEAIMGPIKESCIETLMENCKLKAVIKDQYIEEGGSFEDGNMHYLHSGIARSCYYDPDIDKPIISRIWKKQEVMFDVNSFVNSGIRTEAIQMLEDGELISISYYSLKHILETYPKMLLLLLYLQAEREKHNKFYQHLLKLTVEERVRLYLNDNPTLCNRINKDCIALHLGISRSKFSSAYTLYKQQKDAQTA
ncbi:Crp/Fnr family transcriptional regulator [Pedobacter heparinus]|uniref:Cyclic nucleotide-binding protein n=1 Tax=Pedobacter heparinus (strain ATCC 13125 / DSM 2366 / CIP 104194 / JCM 7457 / NBRC 12017 / NCIMB 9290 / NRRL B-14731 / HIM 762-3) TaxID=485917 RepID=C6XUL4_PEDHD|nr:hypothetical protein [Pedobacter heparinus]ACU03864.1 hypothetical protein Phep_1652 [Pedobacter heparinus DSM 2366]